MHFQRVETNPAAVQINKSVEKVANQLVRGWDRTLAIAGLGGRKAEYDDERYAFEAGVAGLMRRKHLRIKRRMDDSVEPWSVFRNCTADEIKLLNMAERTLSREEKLLREKIRSNELQSQLNTLYSPRQKQALVNILSLIGHGEAYAWLVAGEMLGEVKSVAGRKALTRQALEEAKHFVVMREMIHAFQCPIPRLNVWEYILLERTIKAKGMEKFFGMNVVVEAVALSLFGLLGRLPGLEILKHFHRDEAHHSAMPVNYMKEFPLSRWDKLNPIKRAQRLLLVAPAIGVLFIMEDDLAELGVDVFELGGSLVHKILKLAERIGFYGPMPAHKLEAMINKLFNGYCGLTRSGHAFRDFMLSNTTVGAEELALEKELFELR